MQCTKMSTRAVAPATGLRVGAARRVVVRVHARAAAGGRFASYTSKSAAPAARPTYGSSSGAGSTSKLSAGDLAALRIDDLRELCGKTGTQLPREPTKDGLISALANKGVTLSQLTRGQLVDLCNKLGAPLAKDLESLRRSLAGLVGKSGYSSSSSSASSSWRSTPAPAPAAGDRFSSYSAGATQKASWRRSGSYSAPASSGGAAAGAGKLSAGDLNQLRVDDLSDLASKMGAATRGASNKNDVISALLKRGVSVNDLTRGMLVDLCNKLGAPLAKDVEGLRRSLSGAVGKGGSSAGYSSSSSSSAPSSWRSTPAPAASSAPAEGRFSSYTGRSSSSSNGSSSSSWRSTGSGASSGNDSLFEADLSGFKIDELSNMAAKAGVSLRNATKASLARELAGKLKVSDLTKGQLVEILSKLQQPISGSVEDLRARVKAAASQRQSARSLAGSRW